MAQISVCDEVKEYKFIGKRTCWWKLCDKMNKLNSEEVEDIDNLIKFVLEYDTKHEDDYRKLDNYELLVAVIQCCENRKRALKTGIFERVNFKKTFGGFMQNVSSSAPSSDIQNALEILLENVRNFGKAEFYYIRTDKNNNKHKENGRGGWAASNSKIFGVVMNTFQSYHMWIKWAKETETTNNKL